MTAALASVSDTHRTDPSQARCWSVSAAGRWTVVVATCKEEARLLGLLWIAHHQGRRTVDLDVRTRVAEADTAKVERWLAVREQERTLLDGRNGGGT